MSDIPTMDDRIRTKYKTEYANMKESINDAILTGYQHTSNNGGTYFIAGIGDTWPEEELADYIKNEYEEAGWRLYIEWADRDAEAGRVIVEIYKSSN